MSYPRSGRTTRMLEEALRLVRETDKDVIVIAASGEQTVRGFQGKWEDDHFDDPGTRRRIKFLYGIPKDFNYRFMIPDGYDRERTVVLIDHFVFERQLPWLREMYAKMTQFDA